MEGEGGARHDEDLDPVRRRPQRSPGFLYLTLAVLVVDAEAGRSENTFGAYVFLTVAYLGGAGILLTLRRRAVWALGAVVQVGVIVLFVMFGAGAFGPGQGVFDYDALSGLHMGVWAAVLTSGEVVLGGLLALLALTARPEPR